MFLLGARFTPTKPRFQNPNADQGLALDRAGPLFLVDLLWFRADPGPRNALLAKHLSRKAALCAAQLVLGLCGTVLLFYVPIAVACGESSSIAFVTVCGVRAKHTRPSLPVEVSASVCALLKPLTLTNPMCFVV